MTSPETNTETHSDAATASDAAPHTGARSPSQGEPTRARLSHDHFLQYVLIVIAVVGVALLIWSWRRVLLLAFASIVIAVALRAGADPIAKSTPFGRGGSLAFVAIGLFAGLTGLGWMFGAQVDDQISDLTTRLPRAYQSFQERLAASPYGAAIAEQMRSLNISDGAQTMSGALARLGGFTLSFASAAADALIVFIAAIFLALNPNVYFAATLYLFPRGPREHVREALVVAGEALKKWFLGTLLSVLFVSVTLGVTLWLLGVPAFAALALIAGFAQFVPLVGPLLAVIPGALLALSVSPQTALWTILAYTAISQIEANLVTPIVQHQAVSMPPALSLFSILAMGLLFGPLGVLLAVPIAVVLATLVVKLYVNRVLGENIKAPGEQ